MRQLMISLDNKILDPTSVVARRMVEYGKENELFILIPAAEKKEIKLSETVMAWSTGGNKVQQYFRLKKLGLELIKKYEIKFITVQDPFFLGRLGAWLKKKTSAALEVQLHGDFYGSNYYRHGSLFTQLKLEIGKFVLRYADQVRVAGERIKQSLEKMGISGDKIVVRPVQNDPALIKNYPPKINLHNKYPGYEKIFLVLGRLDPVKNIPWLINVFTEVVNSKPSYLLLILGEGKQYTNLKSKILNLKLEKNIKLEEWTNDPISYIKTADCVLFPSLSEGYGLVAMEAHAAGTPVIMNDVGVANYELKPSEKVTILPINNREKWIEAILRV